MSKPDLGWESCQVRQAGAGPRADHPTQEAGKWSRSLRFVTPSFNREAMLPRLRAEAELAHEHEARSGYI